DLFVIGPEAPLVEGLADRLRAQGKTVLGPGVAGAQLEGSKAFMKEFLTVAGVPSAPYGIFSDDAAAIGYLATMTPPYVIKTDGLAAGKGVLVTSDLDEAVKDVTAKLSGESFGTAGSTIVIEEALVGQECSLHVLCDGTRVVALASAQDYKRVGDQDQGANTGGMGAYAPMGSFTEDQVEDVLARIIAPTLRELSLRGIDFRGVLYAGLMMSAHGPQLLEYNVRFGDPETEVLAPLYGEALYDLLARTASGQLVDESPRAIGAAVGVVLASAGYPHDPRGGDVIEGLGPDGQLAEHRDNVIIFHAGTSRDDQGRFVTSGGRVLCVTALGESVEVARQRVYEAASLITFAGSVRRSDIALLASQE
ncbi:MAG TPA: phosphoribosylamine--glycine ligase, partial [Acidimicrobiales bacterium]